MLAGNVATSRVEGAHSFVKSYIGSSTGDLLTVFNSIANALDAQLNRICYQLADDRIKIPLFLKDNVFCLLHRKVARYALTRLSDEFQKLRQSLLPNNAPLARCTNTFTGTMGLPCAHRLQVLKAEGRPIPLTEIFQFWRIADAEEAQYAPVLEPELPKPAKKTRFMYGGSQRPERRDPVAFEYTEARLLTQSNASTLSILSSQPRSRRQPTCSQCWIQGHTRAQCPQRRQ